MAIYVKATGQTFAAPLGMFLVFAVIGGLAQVIATVLVVTLFKTRNFAVGITLIKTEVLLSVLVGILFLGEGVTPLAFLSILAGLVGVLLLSLPSGAWRDLRRNFDGHTAALGLGAGALFAVSGVCYRGASLQIASDDPLLRAGVTLAVVTSLQMLGMALWLAARDRRQMRAVWQARRRALWIGLLSLAGSLCWFWAFTLQVAAYVKAVGQVELILSLAVSVLLFSERFSLRELAGIAVLGASILTLVLTL
jgi:drug/metabolite transporter (DMT)-like permease